MHSRRPLGLALGLGLLVILLGACSMVPGAGGAALAGSTWSVVSVDGMAPSGTAPVLAFDALGRSVTLTTDCGAAKGSFGMDMDRAALFLDLPSAPPIGCAGDLASRDVALLAALAGVDRWRYESTTEITFHGTHEIRLRRSDPGG